MLNDTGGYRGQSLRTINQAGASVGDRIRIISNGEVYEGTLMPRSELGDENHVVIKLRSGYNTGVLVKGNVRIELVGKGTTPHFSRPQAPTVDENLPHVTIISTGGTIASRVDYRSGAVTPALSAEELYSTFPELAEIASVRAKVLYSFLSENMEPANWTEIAEEIAGEFKMGSNGVVVTHGTDTLAYTASALSFALQDLPGPVVLVGAQRSPDRPSSDAAINVQAAVDVAANAPIAEVVATMHQGFSDTTIDIHRGTRVRKCHTSSRDAFQSVNESPIGVYHVSERQSEFKGGVKKRDNQRRFKVRSNFEPNVALVKFHPGADPRVLASLLDRKIKGLVLEGTGLGHVGKKWFDSLDRAYKSRIPVMVTSQCIWGRVNLRVYDGGRELLKKGVVPLEDMLAETALVKMMWSLGQTDDYEEVKRLMLENIAGEISPRTVPRRAP